MSDAIERLQNCKIFQENYRESAFSDALKLAKDLAALLQVNAQFKPVKIRKRKKQFTYDDEIPDLNDPEKYYKNHVSNFRLDQSLISKSDRSQ